jgi:hypothetical protein
MRKGLTKRRDLRKRIAELERENAWLKSKLRVREITASRYPMRYSAIKKYRVEPYEKDPALEMYAREEAIRACAVSLAKTIAYQATEITEQKWPDGWRAVEMTVVLIPPIQEYAPEIKTAIEEIRGKDA